jgi:hypothetical protein
MAKALLDGPRQQARLQGRQQRSWTSAQRDATGAPWDYEFDVVVVGGGCAGLTAAIRARDLGASVLVVEAAYDVGGRMLQSGSFVSLGGGDPVQRRDMRRARRGGAHPGRSARAARGARRQRRPPVRRCHRLVDRRSHGPEPLPLQRARPGARLGRALPGHAQFLMDNYVRFARINGTHSGGGMSRRAGGVFPDARRPDRHAAGTITAEDAGRADPERTSPFAPVQMNDASRTVGARRRQQRRRARAAARVLGAREGRASSCSTRLRRTVREQPFAGRILGITRELLAAPPSRDRRAAPELLAGRQHRRAARTTCDHPGAPRRHPRQRRPRRQSRGPQHVPSGHAGAGVPTSGRRCWARASRTRARSRRASRSARISPGCIRTSPRR